MFVNSRPAMRERTDLNHGIHGTHGNEDSRKLVSPSVCSVCSVVVANLSLAVGRC